MKKTEHIFQEFEVTVKLMTTRKVGKRAMKSFEKALLGVVNLNSVCTPEVTMDVSCGPMMVTSKPVKGNWVQFMPGVNHFQPSKK